MKCDVCGAERIDNGPCPACPPQYQPQPATSGAHPPPASPSGAAPTEFAPAGTVPPGFAPAGTVPPGFAPIGSGVAATGPVAAGPGAPAGGYTVQHSGGYPMPAFPFRPLRWPATVAVAGIGVGEGVHLLGLTLSAIGLPTYPYGTLSGTGALLTMLGILLDATGGIAFLVWLYRAAYNIRGLPGRYPRWSPGRVVGVWFIPLANLVLGPYGLRDVALNSVPDGDPDRRSHLEGLLNAWWACYVLVTGAGYLMSLVSPDNVVGLVITGAGLGAAAALIIVLIRRNTLIQLSELNARGWLG